MTVDTKHPAYLEFDQDWRQLRDTYRGERIVKERSFTYLPATSGMAADGVLVTNTPGYRAYVAYRARARFPDFVKEAVEAMIGVMHNKPAQIELPTKMEPLLERSTLRGESLQMLLQRITEEQLVTGRVGLLLEISDGPGVTIPTIALYKAEHLINWSEIEDSAAETGVEALNLVVIDETGPERVNTFQWENKRKFRVLSLGDLQASDEETDTSGVYQVGIFRDDEDFSLDRMEAPVVAGSTSERIPFVFINTKDVVATPDEAPLLGLSNLSLTVYRGEADYRQALFMQGQDTLVKIGAAALGEDEEQRVGAGAVIDVPQGGDAKFIGVDSAGLPEMRQSLENDYTAGNQKAGALLEAVSRSAESGEALRVRVAARTASLNQIALAAAFGLQELLKIAAVWMGQNPDDVIVEPNLDFVADIMAGQELTAIMAAKGLGAPLSLQSIHELQQERGLTQRTWEEEQEALAAEAEAGLPGAVMPGEEDESGTADGEEEDEEDLEDEEEGEGDDEGEGGGESNE